MNNLSYIKTLKVLFVEDNIEARETTLAMLSNLFDNITVAVDGLDGYEKFFNDKFDIIITDINMPNMNGIDMSKKIRHKDKDIPILILSAYSELEFFMETIKIGVEGYLIKPIELDQFIQTINKVVDKLYLKHQLKEYQNSLELKVKEQTEQIRLKNKDLLYQHFYDKLTTLPNRNSLLKVLDEDKPYGMMLIDINGFSIINDLYGTDAGDKLLISIADFLEHLNNERYSFYRVGTDQFVFLDLLDDDLNFTNTIVTEILDKIENANITIKIDDTNFIELHVSVTVSIASGHNRKDILKNAEIALHHAKKNNIHMIYYDKNMHLEDSYQREINSVKMIKNAIKEDTIIPYYQSIVKSDGTKSFECLARVIIDNEAISPKKFLKAITNTRYYSEFTKIMIKKSFERFKDCDTEFSLNFMFNDIINKPLIRYLEEQLNTYNVSGRLTIEIIENECIGNFTILNDFIENMRQHNVRIAIDDFGSGYSNFSYLLDMNPDFIKVDGSLVKNIHLNPKEALIVKTIINFAKNLNIKVVCEYVHNELIYNMLDQMGADAFQGYYFSEPKQFV